MFTSKTILVTGINGFVGKHLARELRSRNLDVIGVGHRERTPDPSIAALLNEYYQCDVANEEQVKNLPLESVDCIINLAGLANIGASFDNPELYMNVNVRVLSALGKALYRRNPSARMIAVSTGALYDPAQPMPLNEESKTIHKGSPYALSKIAMEQAAKELHEEGQDCIIVRPFNHIGPGQGLGFLIPDLANKLRQTSSSNPTLRAGNLKTIRDYTDVRDIAKAYADLAIASKPDSTLYNVCSGTGHSGEDIVRALCESLNIDFGNLAIETDQSLIRPSDPQKIVGDSSRLQSETGWNPSIMLEETVNDIVKTL